MRVRTSSIRLPSLPLLPSPQAKTSVSLLPSWHTTTAAQWLMPHESDSTFRLTNTGIMSGRYEVAFNSPVPS